MLVPYDANVILTSAVTDVITNDYITINGSIMTLYHEGPVIHFNTVYSATKGHRYTVITIWVFRHLFSYTHVTSNYYIIQTLCSNPLFRYPSLKKLYMHKGVLFRHKRVRI